MNTPEPCCHCKNLYSDCMHKDDPFYEAECKLGLTVGRGLCKKYYSDKHSNIKRYDKHGILIIEYRR